MFKRIKHFALFIFFSFTFAINQSKAVKVVAQNIKDDVVISEIYTKGSLSSGTYHTNYVMLFNHSDEPFNLDEVSLQYAYGPNAFSLSTTLHGNILPKSYYLIHMRGGSGVKTPLPLDDHESGITLVTTNFKLALVTGSTLLSAQDLENKERIIDYLAVGTSSIYFGQSALPPGANDDKAISRTLFDGHPLPSTDNNRADFSLSTPRPRNSALSVAYSLLENDEEGQCITKYPLIKEQILMLSESNYDTNNNLIKMGQKEYFMTTNDEEINNGRSRYEAWAKSVGDLNPYQHTINEVKYTESKKQISGIEIGLFIAFGILSVILYLKIKRLNYRN